MEKNNYHHGDLKSSMIENGLKLLNEHGYSEFSLRKVATMCGVSHTAPYKHFRNKENLIQEIGMLVSSKFTQTIQEAILGYENDPSTQAIELAKAYIRFMVENPDYLRFLFLNRPGININLDLNAEEKNTSAFTLFKDTVINFFEANEINKNEWYTDLITLWSLVHGLSILIANQTIKYDGDYESLIESILLDKLKL